MSGRRRDDEAYVGILLALVLVVIVGLGIWARVSGPCAMWSFAPAKDIPGRCIMGDK